MLSKPLLKDFLIECKNPGPEDPDLIRPLRGLYAAASKFAYFKAQRHLCPSGYSAFNNNYHRTIFSDVIIISTYY